jgi:S1-C subfamily serine protease
MQTGNSKKILKSSVIATTLIVIVIFLAQISGRIKNLDNQIQKNDQKVNGQIVSLQKQITTINEKISIITGENEKVASSLKEIENKQATKQKSQEELVTGAVAKVAPAVISIIAMKDVPKVEVTYQNPFGDNPLFKDFNIQVPVLKQKGVEQQKVGAGTGFIVTSDGFIVTNKHVIADENASYMAFLPDGKNQKAYVIYRDTTNDVAILKIPGENYKTANFGNSQTLRLGQSVIAIGNALGEYNNSVSVGIISGLNRTIEASGGGVTEKLANVIQTDAAINLGNSGGPLIDLSGQVIGINVATAIGSNNISFSIPINTIKGIVGKIIGKNF